MSPHLEVSDGEHAGRRLRLDGELLLGSAVAGEGHLSDPMVSRRHARLRAGDDGRVVLEDLGSTNGTWVNGRRIGAPRVLDAGDVIRVGRTSFRFAGGHEVGPAPATAVAGARPVGVSPSETVVGGARPGVSPSETVVGGARPGVSPSETVVGGARPGVSPSETVVGGARPGVSPSETVVGGARPGASSPETVVGGARPSGSPRTAPGQEWPGISPSETVARAERPSAAPSPDTVVGAGAPRAAPRRPEQPAVPRVEAPPSDRTGGAHGAIRRHARLASASDGSLLIEQLDGGAPLRVNGEPVRGSRRLAPGDRVEVGADASLVVEAGSPSDALAVAKADTAKPETAAAPATQLKVIAGDATGRWIHPDGEVILGRGTGLPGGVGHDPEVSRRHAAVRRVDAGLVIEDLGAANGTWVNGTRIDAPRALTVGDSVRLGETILLATDAHGQVPDRAVTLSRPLSAPTAASSVEQHLELVDGVGVGRRIPLGAELLIGRSVAGPGRVREDLDVSRRHAVIRREPHGLTVEDLGSANGTYLNGRRIEGKVRVDPGDRLSVGRTTFAVSDASGRVPPARRASE